MLSNHRKNHKISCLQGLAWAVLVGIVLHEWVVTNSSLSKLLLPVSLKDALLERPKYAVAHYVESMDQLYGVYSIHQQLIKYNMTLTQIVNGTHIDGHVSHVVVTPNTMEDKHRQALELWIGPENVRIVDVDWQRGMLKDSGMWAQVFAKLFIFNLTEFDKIIMTDTDLLIRTNIMHWFKYPAPCGVQPKGDVSWNSGAMVIEPSTKIFNDMMELLPRVKRYGPPYGKEFADDPLNGGYSDQDFLTAFFMGHSVEESRERCTMPEEFSMLSSTFGRDQRWDYYTKNRPFIYQTIHFTVDKPWRAATSNNHEFVCSMLRDWFDSVEGIEKYYDLIPPLVHNATSVCPTIPL